jgi:hypothetical protein
MKISSVSCTSETKDKEDFLPPSATPFFWIVQLLFKKGKKTPKVQQNKKDENVCDKMEFSGRSTNRSSPSASKALAFIFFFTRIQHVPRRRLRANYQRTVTLEETTA